MSATNGRDSYTDPYMESVRDRLKLVEARASRRRPRRNYATQSVGVAVMGVLGYEAVMVWGLSTAAGGALACVLVQLAVIALVVAVLAGRERQ